MKIFGAGMAGLLAGNALRRFDPIIAEAQASLPNNHGALLRFRSDACATLTNIPFKKVSVQKSIYAMGDHHNHPSLHLANMYSNKVAGEIMGRSIKNLDPSERFIAPERFISLMGKDLNIAYNMKLTKEFLEETKKREPIISTIPMPVLMDMVDYPKPEFKWQPITSVWGKIKEPKCNIYQTIYFPHPDERPYRVSITGDVYIAEYMHDVKEEDAREDCEEALSTYGWFGFDGQVEDIQIKRQEYGKLLPIDSKVRKEFILYMTDTYGVYSLGRFATWRQILLDDVVQDISVIAHLIEYRDDYTRKLQHTK